MEIKFRYWDGFNLFKKILVTKNTRIGTFLEKCRQDLGWQFHELRRLNAEYGLLYVLDEWIIPPNATFYDVLVTLPPDRTSSLFEFVRAPHGEYDVEVNEPGKVVQRMVYERGKHIYPCCLWKKLEGLPIQY